MFNPYKDISTIVAVDYDGTIVDEKEELIPEAVSGMYKLRGHGIRIILWSCRDKEYLESIREKLYLLGIDILKVNDNCDEVINHYGDNGRKVFAHFYYDDQSFGFRKTNWEEFVEYVIEWHRKRWPYED